MPGSFSARRTAPVEALHLEVRDVGPVRLPVPPAQARRLARLGRPAPFGRGQETLLDPRVRDTSEIPKSRVRIDRRRWNATLRPLLEGLRSDLGLPATSRLKAELHSVLVYAGGQFFVPHQDSEKADDMVGSLVVTLPSTFRGGSLVVEHGGKTATYRASKSALTLVAFYADCRHEVRPVSSGHRIVLTYNLLLEGETDVTDSPRESVETLATLLDEHFTTARPTARMPHRNSSAPPPDRLVYLLDHQYTTRALSWSRLKGGDARRAAALRAAADLAGCDIVLALADVHETWSCLDDQWHGRWRRHPRAWERLDDDDMDDDIDGPGGWPAAADPTGPDDAELDELVDWAVTLDRWIAPEAATAERVATAVGDDEVCATTATADLRPYASEYEGYMGNYGNTLDRWYHRGALVVWPRTRAFAVRAEASPAWALGELARRARAGNVAEARQLAETLAPFWRSSVEDVTGRGLLVKALKVARTLEEPALAGMLLQPFRVELLKPKDAQALAALVDGFGQRWARELLATWSRPARRWRPAGVDRSTWVASLPRICEALSATGANGIDTARLLIEDCRRWLDASLAQRLQTASPSRREEAVGELARPLLAVLESTAVIGAADLRDDAVRALTSQGEGTLRCLLAVLRAAEGLPRQTRAAAGLDAIAQHCTHHLKARLARPTRAPDDWSIDLPRDCDCELCETLGEFLSDPARRSFEWPLAKERRRHIHSRIDGAELPVRHQTRRSGRPYTLVLTKTETLFEGEEQARRLDLRDLTGLAEASD